jgi:predicted small secreted protein
VSIQNKVHTNIYGVGIKQSLANMKSFLVPMIGIGHAKQMKSGGTSYTIRDSSGDRILEVQRSKNTVDSTSAMFSLKINFSQRMGITGSVKTVFPAFEWDKARDSVKYEAGISVLF